MTTRVVKKLTFTPTGLARPFVKWAGGKRQLLPELRKHVPARFERYFEPFVGGGALFFDLKNNGYAGSAMLGDANADLIATYVAVRDDVEAVLKLLATYQQQHRARGERFYYELRSAKKPLSGSTFYAIVAARFIALNKLGFNGLYRVNRAGTFNVPYGKWKTYPTVYDPENLRECARALGGVTFHAGDFAGWINEAGRGDFVYFDPPYWPVSATSDFTAYTRSPFGPDEQERLRDVALRLKKRGVHVLLSNADVPPVRKLYARGFSMRRVEALRAINSDSGKRGKVDELLIY